MGAGLVFSCVYLTELRFFCVQILGLSSEKMNKLDRLIHDGV